MTVFQALRLGMRDLARHKRLCFLFYAATTAAALLIAAPAMTIALHSLGDSALAQEMAGNLDPAWFSELATQYGALPWTQILVVLCGVGTISAVVYLFFLGGALQVLCTGDPFFTGCGRNFWRMVRLTLVSLVFYAGAMFVYGRMGAVGRKIWGEGSEATPLMHWGWFRAAALLLMFGCINLVFDYARVSMVVDNRRKAIQSTIAAIRFVWRNLWCTAGLFVVVCAIAAAFFAAYLGLSHTVAQTSVGLVLFLLVARQAMVFAKIWSRLLFCSTAIELYGALKPPPVIVAEMPEPEPEMEAPPEPTIEIALAPELFLNAFQFITLWNQTPECRAAAEARLPGLPGVSGVLFDPATLTGKVAVLTRLAEGAPAFDELVRKALASGHIEGPVTIVEEISEAGGLRRLSVAVAVAPPNEVTP